ncbi:transposase [Paraburkholderia youngii]
MNIATVGLDLAKNVLQVHAVDSQGHIVVRKQLRRTDVFLLEFGISLPVGHAVLKRLSVVLAEHPLRPRLVAILERPHAHFKYLTQQIGDIEKELDRQLAEDPVGQRLLTIPGVGPITASLLALELGDGKQYRCGRDFAAAVGLVPNQYSTGGRANLLGISQCPSNGNTRPASTSCNPSTIFRYSRML